MKVMIIDDNQSITEMLAKYLQIKEFDVTVTNDGRNGLNLMRQQKFDIVLMDLSMPEFTGMDILEELERKDQLRSQNIIILTASAIPQETIDELLQKEGVVTCLKKPVRMPVLLQTITS